MRKNDIKNEIKRQILIQFEIKTALCQVLGGFGTLLILQKNMDEYKKMPEEDVIKKCTKQNETLCKTLSRIKKENLELCKQLIDCDMVQLAMNFAEKMDNILPEDEKQK